MYTHCRSVIYLGIVTCPEQCGAASRSESVAFGRIYDGLSSFYFDVSMGFACI